MDEETILDFARCVQRLETAFQRVAQSSAAVPMLAAALANPWRSCVESRVVRDERGCRLEITVKPRR